MSEDKPAKRGRPSMDGAGRTVQCCLKVSPNNVEILTAYAEREGLDGWRSAALQLLLRSIKRVGRS